jgi:hypothetical protein
MPRALRQHFLPAVWLLGASWLLGPACAEAPRPAADAADPGPAAQLERTARLLHTQGEVHVKRLGASDWQAAGVGLDLRAQDKLRTLRDAFATIEFEHGGLLRLGPDSLISVTDLRQDARGQARRSTFTLEEGALEAELDPLEGEGSEFRIKTPSAEASVARREVAFQ